MPVPEAVFFLKVEVFWKVLRFKLGIEYNLVHRNSASNQKE